MALGYGKTARASERVIEADQHAWVVMPESRKVLEAAVKYLWGERAFLSKSD